MRVERVAVAENHDTVIIPRQSGRDRKCVDCNTPLDFRPAFLPSARTSEKMR